MLISIIIQFFVLNLIILFGKIEFIKIVLYPNNEFLDKKNQTFEKYLGRCINLKKMPEKN